MSLSYQRVLLLLTGSAAAKVAHDTRPSQRRERLTAQPLGVASKGGLTREIIREIIREMISEEGGVSREGAVP